MKTCVVIYNPKSGRKKLNMTAFDKMKTILNDYGYTPRIIFTEYKGHAQKIVRELEQVDLIISIGGDGTFNEAVRGNLLRKKQILQSHLPFGTTNDIGVMLGYGEDLYNNLELSLNGIKKKMDICSINDVPFTYSACIGKFADIPYLTPSKLKKKVGYLAYLIQGIKILRNKSVPLYDITFKCNGKSYQGKYSFMIVSSADRIAGFSNVYKDIKLDDNKFEILFCSLTKKIEVIKAVSYLLKGEISKAPGFEFYRTDKINISFKEKPRMNWCIDGEKLDNISNEYIIDNMAKIEVLIPRKKIDDLFVDNKQ